MCNPYKTPAPDEVIQAQLAEEGWVNYWKRYYDGRRVPIWITLGMVIYYVLLAFWSR